MDREVLYVNICNTRGKRGDDEECARWGWLTTLKEAITKLVAHDNGIYVKEWAVSDAFENQYGRTEIPRDKMRPLPQSYPNDMTSILGPGRNPVRRRFA